MGRIVFFDTEVTADGGRIVDFGAVDEKGERIHTGRMDLFMAFIKEASFLCGHNIIKHDLRFIERHDKSVMAIPAIDTLALSPLLFPRKPYHRLVKDDKLHTEQLNNPLNDAIQSKDLFYDICSAFEGLDGPLKAIYKGLLKNQKMFKGFFEYLDRSKRQQQALLSLFGGSAVAQSASARGLGAEIRSHFKGIICDHAPIDRLIASSPVELAYCLAVLNVRDDSSVTPRWVVRSYPEVHSVMSQLRSKPCLSGCSYCDANFDPVRGLQDFFGYDAYRTFDGVNLQEMAVDAALQQKSLLAIFPTGGGKSITFQVPALMAGKMTKGLTVVISPLQSLMKDQVDNLEKKGITDAVTINGLLDPIERANAFERVEDGSAKIVYLSPEALRSKSIERLLLGRRIERFVIDEAHCFSVWGQDFRVDYLYIAPFIKRLVEHKNLQSMIPVSCFTATAKQNVVSDIRQYFKEHLNLELEIFSASAARKNLSYKVIPCGNDEKYERLRDLIGLKQCPTIVYVSKTRVTELLADRLCKDGYRARAYHGKMENKQKSANQDLFSRGDVDVMVATSAFGMGVDKADVGLVVHYQISNSLENYVQEAGRAGRDEHIKAECYVLYDDEDLNAHFTMLNQTKLNIQEIGQIWKAIKDLTKVRRKVSQSALEIARKAGWNDSVMDLETRVKTAISALEQAGYLKRGQNMPRVYADSILAQSTKDAAERIRSSGRFEGKDTENAVRIITMLISARSRKNNRDGGGESRIDYISDMLGMTKEDVIRIVGLLREEKILSDSKDLSAFMTEDMGRQKSFNMFKWHKELEAFLMETIQSDGVYNLKSLNEEAESLGLKKVSTDKIINVLNFWEISKSITRETSRYSKNHVRIELNLAYDKRKQQFERRTIIAEFILQYLHQKHDNEVEEEVVEFSVLELKEAFEFENRLLSEKTTIKELENGLFYLTKIGALKIEGGFMVLYSGLEIERIELDNRIQYKNEDYKKLKAYYDQKVHQIHIVGEYARKMLEDYEAALAFVDDYFTLNYQIFLKKYFKGSKGEEIGLNITPAKFKQLFGGLNPAQLSIVNDRESKYIVVAAGPGSGKTRILVHKLAALLLMEDVKHEQLLMLTFSRAAVTEFKKRLTALIGNAARYVEINTFHSYCFDLLGRVGDIEKSGRIVAETAELIKNGEVEPSRITKTVMVIDEAQDMDASEFELVRAMMLHNEDLRIIAVGDDDQNIYGFRGSSSEYMKQILAHSDARMYELVENYRSKSNLVELSNTYALTIPNRMKSLPIIPRQSAFGDIEFVYHPSDAMMDGVIEKLIGDRIKGSICILTATNDAALQMTGRLNDVGLKAKLIQSRDEVRLENLDEVRFFLGQLGLGNGLHTIDVMVWAKAKHNLFQTYARSEQLTLIKRMLLDFEDTSGKSYYVSDLMMFLRESKSEDFLDEDVETIQVSTMHKAKGQEFDSVIILLDGFSDVSPEAKRVLYVAMTRAKSHLQIHYREPSAIEVFDEECLKSCKVKTVHMPVAQKGKDILILQLGYKDIFLSFYYNENVQSAVSALRSGDELIFKAHGCYTKDNVQVLVFSKGFREKLKSYMARGYGLTEARVNAVVHWRQAEQEDEVKIVFPVLKMS